MSDMPENQLGSGGAREEETPLFDTDEISASDRLRIMAATRERKIEAEENRRESYTGRANRPERSASRSERSANRPERSANRSERSVNQSERSANRPERNTNRSEGLENQSGNSAPHGGNLDDLEYFSVKSGERGQGRSSRARASEGEHRSSGQYSSGRSSRRDDTYRETHSRNRGGRSGSASHSRKRRKRRTRIKMIVMIIILALLSVLLVFALMINNTLSKMNRVVRSPKDIIDAAHETFERDTDAADTISNTDLDTDGIVAMKDHDIKNILLIGQDLRQDDQESRARSDTMILCSLNTDTNQIYLTSLMRDMYVEIPGYSNNKLNAAYFFGGMELLDETLEKNFGIKVDANMVVDFEGFMETMTTIGDLNLELTAEEADYINSHNYYGSTEDQWQFDQDWTLH